MKFSLSISLFIISISVAFSADATIGDLRLSMPDGFVQRIGKGIDSKPGDLTHTKSGWQIYYDMGIGAHYGSNEKLLKMHEGKIEQKENIETPFGKGLLLVLGPDKRRAFFGIEGVGYFHAMISSDQELKDFKAIISSIRLTDEAQSHRNRKEQEKTKTAQPDINTESKPEGGNKPQPEAEEKSH
jgi:hypothetical protein